MGCYYILGIGTLVHTGYTGYRLPRVWVPWGILVPRYMGPYVGDAGGRRVFSLEAVS